MIKILKNAVTLTFGVLSISRDKAKEWVEQNQVLERGEREKAEFKGVVDKQLQKAFHKLNVPSKADYIRLEQRIQELEKQQA